MWKRTDTEIPEDNTLCEVITEGGDQRDLIYDRNLWWLPDKSMYCYFVPVFWKVK